MKVYVTNFVVWDYEGTYTTVLGVASTEERAREIGDIYVKALLEQRTKMNDYCVACHFQKSYHTDEWRKKFTDGKANTHFKALATCKYVAPEPITKLRDEEGVEIEDFELDAPTEKDI